MDWKYSFPTQKLEHLEVGHQNEQQQWAVAQYSEWLCKWAVQIIVILLNPAPR